MPEITLGQLQRYAQNADREYRVVSPDDGQAPQVESREGTWHGRLVRDIKAKEPSIDRGDKQLEYGGFHQSVRDSLVRIYGETIADRAFRAGGFGFEDRKGVWRTDNNFPLTGRHIDKMLRAAETEMQRNAPIAGWMDGILGLGQGQVLDVRLGAKVSTPGGQMSADEAHRQFGEDLNNDIQTWLDESNERHGFWVLDIGRGSDGRERVGIHVDRNDPNVLHILGSDRENRIHRSEFAGWLNGYMPERFPNGVKEMQLHRAEQDNSRWLSEMRWNSENAVALSADDVTKMYPDMVQKGVQNWMDDALKAIDASTKLVRNDLSVDDDRVSLTDDPEALREEVDVHLAHIDQLLGSLSAGLFARQTHLDERRQFNGVFADVRLPPDGVNDQALQQEIDQTLQREADRYLNDLNIRQRSLTEPEIRREMCDTLRDRFDEVLREANWPEEARRTAYQATGARLNDLLTELNTNSFMPLRQQREQQTGPMCGEIERMLEYERTKLAQKSEALAMVRDQPYEPNPMAGNLDRQGLRVNWEWGDNLDRTLPAQLSFNRRGDETFATVSNLFGHLTARKNIPGYERTGHRALLWETVQKNQDTRLGSDKSGVPGAGRGQQISAGLLQRMDATVLDIKVGAGDRFHLNSEQKVLDSLERIESPDGEPLNLSLEQRYALTRFLNDEAFQEVRAQAVKRLCPSGTPTDCQNVTIVVQTRWDENHRPVFDITFRAPLSDAGELAYRAVDRHGRLSDKEQTHWANNKDVELTMTLHVPVDQLQQQRPKVVLDPPCLVFRELPDDVLDRAPHELADLTFDMREGRQIANIADLVPDVAIKGHDRRPLIGPDRQPMSFAQMLSMDVGGQPLDPRGGTPSPHLAQDIHDSTPDLRGSRGDQRYKRELMLRAPNGGPQRMTGADQVMSRLETIKSNVVAGNSELSLSANQKTMLTRFLNADVFDSYYDAVMDGLGGRVPGTKPSVEFEVVANRDGDNVVFDITMRGHLPDTVERGDPDPTNGQELDLVVGLRVPYDQLLRLEPKYQLLPPEIQTRPA